MDDRTTITSPQTDKEWQSDTSSEHTLSSEGGEVSTSDGGLTRTSEGRGVPTSEDGRRTNKIKRKWLRKLTNRETRNAEKIKNRASWGKNPRKNKQQGWNSTVQAQELHKFKNVNVIFNTKRTTKQIEMAISDSGTSGHFVLKNAPVVNK